MNTVKGVNKQIVEINYTRDDYVQKAILIINPDKNHLGEKILNQKAHSYMDKLQPPKPKKKHAIGIPFLKASLYFLLGACIMLLITYLF
ncbi:hypothetical protein RBG61_09685 [Paludicola sp. MB14-C6]|uniref:hypothetical protein n=1 Tax=Paludihabitans sp. MB14-C6 TaxID=3070656 RepID=UPI0027DD83CB|nr:hypothetical protein [Paludicola sp. MB14-C6]WMJ22258.1 hypothetical protein RBG61_09685 [Paludicola sp. MB14-C6]